MITQTQLNDAYAKRTKVDRFFTPQNFQAPKRKIEWQAKCDLRTVKQIFWNALEYAIDKKPEVLPKQFVEICQWLHSNDGKGLLLFGNCGQGKTIIARYVIPTVLQLLHEKVTHYYDIADIQANSNLMYEAMRYAITVIDDVGTEAQSSFKDMAFGRILDNAEKNGKIIIATTNLSGEALKQYYGDRNYDRICGIMKRVMFDGKESFRTK